jgi:hypothetical protein
METLIVLSYIAILIVAICTFMCMEGGPAYPWLRTRISRTRSFIQNRLRVANALTGLRGGAAGVPAALTAG